MENSTEPKERARQAIAWAAHNGIPLNDQWETDDGKGIEVLLGTNERLAALTFLPGQNGQVVLFENGRRLEPSFDARAREPLRSFLTAKPPRVMLEVHQFDIGVFPTSSPRGITVTLKKYVSDTKEGDDLLALLQAAIETGRVFIERAP